MGFLQSLYEGGSFKLFHSVQFFQDCTFFFMRVYHMEYGVVSYPNVLDFQFYVIEMSVFIYIYHNFLSVARC
jgi:hypothetical protein